MQIENLKLPDGTITEIAKRTGLHEITISRYFKGNRTRPYNKIKILEALEVILSEQKQRETELKDNIKNLLK